MKYSNTYKEKRTLLNLVTHATSHAELDINECIYLLSQMHQGHADTITTDALKTKVFIRNNSVIPLRL